MAIPCARRSAARAARVLAGDEGRLPQDPQGPQGQVLEVAEGGRDDEERAGARGGVGHLTPCFSVRSLDSQRGLA